MPAPMMRTGLAIGAAILDMLVWCDEEMLEKVRMRQRELCVHLSRCDLRKAGCEHDVDTTCSVH